VCDVCAGYFVSSLFLCILSLLHYLLPLSVNKVYIIALLGLMSVGLLASSCRPSVFNAEHCGSHGRCTGLKVVPACS